MRQKSDEDLKKIVETLDDNELTGLMFGMLPMRIQEEHGELSGQDVAYMMGICPKGHY